MPTDSIARGVPINAITLYEDAQDGGFSLYEVIDESSASDLCSSSSTPSTN